MPHIGWGGPPAKVIPHLIRVLRTQTEEQPKTYDFAVVTLVDTYTISDSMRPICLPKANMEDMGQKVGGWLWVGVRGKGEKKKFSTSDKTKSILHFADPEI